MTERIKQIKIKTEHFEATVNVAERTFSIFGDFRTKDVYKIPGDPYSQRVLKPIIDELYDLEGAIRSMLPVIKETTLAEEDIPWLSDASDS